MNSYHTRHDTQAHRSSHSSRPGSSNHANTNANVVPPFKTEWYEQVLDHFSFSDRKPHGTFKQRVLVCDQFWDKGTDDAPMFFYTGNEGDIEMFYHNTGLMFDLAPKFRALIVFAEHRYYGQSLPMGDKSWTPDNIQYLNSWQALADYALLIPDFKRKYGMSMRAPVIVFGGSYGGMLSTYMRIKYPHIVDGAIASSAPVTLFEGLASPKAFNQIITKDYADVLPNRQCSSWIQKAFLLVQSLGQSTSGRNILSQRFSLCSPLKTQNDAYQLNSFLYNSIAYLAMLDYPYETDFLQPLPAWPVNASCHAMKNIMDHSGDQETSLLLALASVPNVYYNTSGTLRCFNLTSGDSPGLGLGSWFYQACTEMILVVGQYGGDSDMFLYAPWDLKAYTKMCQDNFGVTPRPYWNIQHYGIDNLQYASNIVFSNGDLDPWTAGGVLKSPSDSIITLFIEQGAHHLDLRSAHPNDPQSVVDARNVITQNIAKWIRDKK